MRCPVVSHTYSMFPCSLHTQFLAHIHHGGSFNAIDFHHTFVLGIGDDGLLTPLSCTFQVDVDHGFVSREEDGIVVYPLATFENANKMQFFP